MLCPKCQSENDELAETCFRCGQGLYAVTAGSVISGRYEILSAIGKGGMGMVYKALDRELDETVALKVLRPEIAGSPDIIRRFRSEIKLARRVSHKNVCRIHEYGRDGHRAYIVMEHLEGVDMKRTLKERGALPAVEAYDVAIQIAQALQAIHDVGIAHRDLKSANVIRDAQGVVKLMDFGIAKSFESGTVGTATGLIVGTPEYMSPEQARAERVDARSDIYALGIVTYELFTGNVPFRGDTPLATLMKHIQDPPPLGPPLPPRAVPVLAKALAKAREDRFDNAQEMADALRLARGDAPLPEAPRPAPYVASSAVPLREPARDPTPAPTPVPTPVPTHVPTVVARPARVAPVGGSTRRQQSGAIRPVPPPSSSAWVWVASVGVGLLLLLAVGVAIVVTRIPGGPGQRVAQTPGAPPTSAPARVADDKPVTLPSATAPPAAAVPSAAAGPPARTEPTVATRPPATSLRPASIATPTPRPATPPPTTITLPPPTTSPLRAIDWAPARESTPPPAPSSTLPAQPSPRAAEHPEAPASPAKAAEATGLLQIGARPYASVSVDGADMGTTPTRPIVLKPGSYTVRLAHPDYQPLLRKITIRAGETTKLSVDLSLDGIRK
jgi:serine/threonine-protein kinase